MGLATCPAVVKERIVFVKDELCAVRFTPEGGVKPDWSVGDFFYLLVPSMEQPLKSVFLTKDKKPVARAYTLSNWGDPHYEVVVVREGKPEPYVSQLLQIVQPGDVMQVSTPQWVRSGKISMKPEDWSKKLLFFGGGTGAVHALDAARYIGRHDDLDPDVWVIASFRTLEWAFFHEEFAQIAKKKKNFKYALSLTRDERDIPGFLKGRAVVTERDPATKAITGLKKDLFAELIPDLAERYPYLCGSDQMKDDVFFAWEKAGIPKERIKYEAWG